MEAKKSNQDNMDKSSGRSGKNPRAHMKNQPGKNSSAQKAVENRVKGTGGHPSNKDGLQ